MAAIKISDLPSVETPTLSDVLPSVNNGETKKITLEQIKNLAGGGSGGTSNYEDLINKPKINNVELTFNLIELINRKRLQRRKTYLSLSQVLNDLNFFSIIRN